MILNIYYRKIDVLEKTASEISDVTGNKVNLIRKITTFGLIMNCN